MSVCSGIEAATVAWHPLGWKPAAFSEIEAFPRAVLQHHYPDVPLHGDFTTIRGDEYGAIDLLVGGTPCQAFSVAGLRKGFADERGNLTLEYLRLAQRTRPRWVVWENVPGVLSIDGGRAFGAFLGGLAQLGYGFAYRILDAQFFGVPQRRRRIFVVGYLGDWRPAAAVLFERESLSGNPPPRREAREEIAPTISARPTGGGGLGTDFDLDGGLVEYAIQAGALRENPASGPDGVGVQERIAYTLEARAEVQAVAIGVTNAEGADGLPFLTASNIGKTVNNQTPLITHSLRGEGFDASEDGTGRGTLLVPVAFAQNSRDEVRVIGGDGQTVGALAAEPGMKQQAYIAFSSKDHGADAGDTAPTLRAIGHSGSHANAGGQVAVAFQPGNLSRGAGSPPSDATFPTLKSDHGRGLSDQAPHVMAASSVRRLTPRECERLQGFPDDFTLIPYRGKPAADGPRYKALGNSMAVPVMAWIGQRIQMVDDLCAESIFV